MIRFIDLKGQIDDDPTFAFFDTVTDRFVDLNGEQTWDSVSDFKADVEAEGIIDPQWLDRCLRLIPKGYFHDSCLHWDGDIPDGYKLDCSIVPEDG